ncbi:hypothetical protein LCGC14_1912280 [marine sediment metagenome]|uniref:Uncharacterized protein n=1 Tax=marine sediment metagenome TaxID=412755 RepID=A0A0F9GGF7_9ZZZZ
MPCSDGRDGRIVYVENPEKVDRLTRMLCSLCRAVDEHNNDQGVLSPDCWVSMPNNIAKWWDEHKEQDRVRTERAKVKAETMKKKKKLRRSGLSKLTDEERTVLGLQKRR